MGTHAHTGVGYITDADGTLYMVHWAIEITLNGIETKFFRKERVEGQQRDALGK